jgi:hypothetical protein
LGNGFCTFGHGFLLLLKVKNVVVFINKKINYQGQDFESIPFGSGRRRCPGIQLGLTTIKLVIAQLVHCFNWELPCNISPSNLNMDEKFGLSMPRAQHLHVILRYRLADQHE